MVSLLDRLAAAARWGAVLAAGTGCGGETEGATRAAGGPDASATGGRGGQGTGATGPDAGGGGQGGAGGASGRGGRDAGTAGAPIDASGDAPPEPTGLYPTPAGCTGPFHDGGYWGQCCEYAKCMPRELGTCVSAAAGAERLGGITGSGTCECGPPPRGPFLPRDPSTEAECCYVYGTISCDGRPLTVAGVVRRAPATRRADWARARPAATTPWERAA